MYSKLQHLHDISKVLRTATKSLELCANGLLFTFVPTKAEQSQYIKCTTEFVKAVQLLDAVKGYLSDLSYLIVEEEEE